MSVENTSKQIEVVTYNPDWPSDFEKEAASIKEALGDNSIEIHHIGSTSVPGLAAKPIIDIIGLVQSISRAIKQLNKIGYENRGEMFLPFREYFRKGKGINLHIYENSSPEIELNLLFRDYLRSHPEQAKEYTQLKYNLLKEKLSFEKNYGVLTGYNLGKDVFIRSIIQKSGFNLMRIMFCNHHFEWDNYHRIRDEQIFSPINIVYDKNHPSIRSENHFHFVLYKNVEIVCIAHVEFLNECQAAIRSLATDEPCKMKGYGKTMLQLLEKWIKSKGISIIKLHANPDAENFYRKLGYSDMEFDDISISEETIDLGKIL